MKKLVILFVVWGIFFISFASAAEYDRILTEMNKIVADNPSYAQMMDIGKNDQGNTIYGLKVENPNFLLQDRAKANHLLVGVHHGNERNSADLCTNFAKKLILRFQDKNSTDYAALSSCIFYVVPVLNISGFNASRRYETNKSGSSIDPNRDYPDVCVNNKYFQLASTQNLSYFVEQYNIVASVTAHGYVGTFTYPWGFYTSNTKTLDHDKYDSMGKASVKANSYRTGTHADVIYPASGSYEDWAYYKHGIWTMLIELKSSSGDLSKDCECMLTFFGMAPSEKSKQHQHTGTCTSTVEERSENGRP